MWTEPSPAEELAEAIKRQLEDARPRSHYTEEQYMKKGWDETEEIHNKKLELFKKLKDPSLSPSEIAEIMSEINKLSE